MFHKITTSLFLITISQINLEFLHQLNLNNKDFMNLGVLRKSIKRKKGFIDQLSGI